VRAVRDYHDRSGTVFAAGSLHDSRDAWVVANPSLFVPDDPQAA
jgi:hypothetical protein